MTCRKITNVERSRLSDRAARPAWLVPLRFGLPVFAATLATVLPAQDAPYRTEADWLQPDRPLGSVSDVGVSSSGVVWVAERCGDNACIGRDELAPIMSFDTSGRPQRTFGQGMFAWPHGLHVDAQGNVWVTDGRAEGGRGHQVLKFAADGRLLMRLGEAGVPGSGPGRFDGPTDVIVAPNGDIFVSDGHESDSNNRVMKFAADGRFIKAWGGSGSAPGLFDVPHALAMDTRGRLFVADRNNNRVQIFDQEGELLDVWTQFGRPSGIFIDAQDRLYVADNQSNEARNPGWRRGIRIGSARDGSVNAFIPDPDFDPTRDEETGAHGIAADAAGTIYGAEVWSRTLKKYLPLPERR